MMESVTVLARKYFFDAPEGPPLELQSDDVLASSSHD